MDGVMRTCATPRPGSGVAGYAERRGALVHSRESLSPRQLAPLTEAPSTHPDEARVIVVDDAVDVAEAMAFALESDGYKVWIAHDGNEALEMVARHDPHCVLFDIDMPGLDGSELSKRLREAHGDDLILVAVTGWSDKDSRVADAFARVDHYLRKPVDPAVLRKLLPPV